MQQKNLAHHRVIKVLAFSIIFAASLIMFGVYQFGETHGHASARLAPDRSWSDSLPQSSKNNRITVYQAVRNDVSRPLAKPATAHDLSGNA